MYSFEVQLCLHYMHIDVIIWNSIMYTLYWCIHLKYNYVYTILMYSFEEQLCIHYIDVFIWSTIMHTLYWCIHLKYTYVYTILIYCIVCIVVLLLSLLWQTCNICSILYDIMCTYFNDGSTLVLKKHIVILYNWQMGWPAPRFNLRIW